MFSSNYPKILQLIKDQYSKIFWGILLIAFLLRIFASFFAGLSWFTTDSYSYLRMAEAILNGDPVSRFPNGFPLLIAFIKLGVPEYLVPPAIITLNILLSTAVVGLGMKISKLVSGDVLIACFTGIIIAAYPNQLNYVRQILSETPTVFFLVLSVFLFLKRTYFLAGVFLVITIWFRSSLLPFLPFMLICFYFFEKSDKTKIRLVKFAGGMVLTFLIYRSILWLGIIEPSNNLGVNLLISISSLGGDINYTLDGFKGTDFANPIRSYLTFAFDHPMEFLKQRLYSFNELWLWPSDGIPPRSLITKLLISLRIPLLFAAVIGFFRNIKRVEIWVLFMPILIITMIHTLFFSTPRFTYVIEPFTIILAVIAFFEVFSISQKNKKSNI